MGSKNSPETPRQRMIMLMYLVLTAMLALNVDKKVLDAFALVNDGFMSTIENFNIKNENVYSQFSSAALENPQKVGELNRSVARIKKQTNDLYNYITELKTMIVQKADGPEGKIDNIQLKEDLDASAELMISKGNGTKLKQAIEIYRDSLLKYFDPKDSAQIASIKKSLDTSSPETGSGIRPSWENSKFEGYPLIAVITLMSKMQSDIRNSESDVINYLHAKIDASSFKFNNLKAQVIPKSDYILLGEPYEAKVFISAIDTTVSPEILVNGSKLPMVPGENAGLYKVTTSKEGNFIWSGVINYKNPSGIIVPYAFKEEYQVARPTMTVSPTKMNVLYFGLPNPISVSAPGVPSNSLKVSMSNGRIEPKGDGSYIAYPDKGAKEAVITVAAEIDKAVKPIGNMLFRVKIAPNPTAVVAGKNSGTIGKSELLAQQAVFAEMPEGFDFEMKVSVLSFVISTTKAGYLVEKESTSNKFTADQISLMNGLSTGNRLYIDNIVAKGEDGITRNLSAIILKIK